MTAQQLRCAGNCGRRFGKRARTLLPFSTFVLCPECADDPAVHRRLFAGCLQKHDSCRAHGGDVVSIGRARQALATTIPGR